MLSKKKVFIGTMKMYGEVEEKIYLSRHSWDCDWYWGLGYLGNKNCHFHMSGMIPNKSNENKIVFDLWSSEIELNLLPHLNGWKLMELFSRAYTMKDYSELLYLGTSGVTNSKPDMKDKEEAKKVNKKLEELLNYIWEYVSKDEK